MSQKLEFKEKNNVLDIFDLYKKKEVIKYTEKKKKYKQKDYEKNYKNYK